ncbi:MAG TPA: protein kinase [Pyrinomonadaceae bacterium]|jgi:serine/threonine protein kinase|nr:protein kinase [Pyrinomonadaceae bacterium]
MLAPDTILQTRYRVIRQLGQGGMGTVYEAVDQRLDTTVALKESRFTDEKSRKQFEREARLLAKLQHPAMTRVIDHFEEGDGQFLVMDFIPGEDLGKMLQDGAIPFPPDKVLKWGDQLLDALDFLHTQNPPIIHRDIKPLNLKLTTQGKIILLDFGLAKGFIGQTSHGTTTDSIYGYTRNYAPLEQIRGTGTDARTDLYSLAATLYHLMTGVLPPDALTRASELVGGEPDPLLPANEINPQVPAEVAYILKRALALKREHRPATAAELRQSIGNASEFLTTSDSYSITQKPQVSEQTIPSPIHQSEPTLPAILPHSQESPPPSVRKPARSLWIVSGLSALLAVGLVLTFVYKYSHSAASTASATPTEAAIPSPSSVSDLSMALQREINNGRLVTLTNDDAYTYFSQLKQSDPKNEKLAEIKSQVLPQLRSMGDEVIKQAASIQWKRLTERDWMLAQRVYEWAKTLDPNDKAIKSRWRYSEASLARLKEDKDGAERGYLAATQLDPNWALPHFSLGLLRMRRFRNDPNDPSAANRGQAAIPYFQRAIALEPKWETPYMAMGTAYFLQQDYVTAEQYYRQAMAMNPDWGGPHAWMGEIYRKKGMCAPAIEEYEKAIGLGLEDDSLDAVETQKAIRQLREDCGK